TTSIGLTNTEQLPRRYDMAGNQDFTPEEWTQVLKSPLMSSLVVVAASPSGPIGVLEEMFAVGKLVAETKAKGAANPLVEAVVTDLTARENMEKVKPTEIQGKSPEQARAYALEQLKAVATVVDGKAGGDSAGFREWLQEVARRVANASKEGGFLGFGGTLVSDQEQAALRDTAAALGV